MSKNRNKKILLLALFQLHAPASSVFLCNVPKVVIKMHVLASQLIAFWHSPIRRGQVNVEMASGKENVKWIEGAKNAFLIN